jgi:hypothetical protein
MYATQSENVKLENARGYAHQTHGVVAADSRSAGAAAMAAAMPIK